MMTVDVLLRDLERAYEALEGPVFEQDASYARRLLARLGERLRAEGVQGLASRDPEAPSGDRAPWEGDGPFVMTPHRLRLGCQELRFLNADGSKRPDPAPGAWGSRRGKDAGLPRTRRTG